MLRRVLLCGSYAVLLALGAGVYLLPAAAQTPQQPGGGGAKPATRPTGVAADPIVMPNAKLAVIVKQEVPSLREGYLEFIGREVRPGEVVPSHIHTWTGENGKLFRQLKEGDEVKENDLLARLDTRLAQAELNIKAAKHIASQADYVAAQKLTEEGRQRFQTAERLFASRAISLEDLRGAEVTWQKYRQEEVAKKEAINSAKAEMEQAQVVLQLHDIRSKIGGRIKTIYKQPGEAVKAQDGVFQVYNFDRLRVEGVVPTQFRHSLRKGMKVVVEPTQPEGPEQTLRGHRQDITGVAVSNDPKNRYIVSSSEDGTVRVWERATRYERRVLRHPGPVRAVACNPTGAPGHLALSGAVDGVARIWDLNSDSEQPLRELKGEHRGSVTCVAFSPDGKLCATGGVDRTVCVWDTETGALRCKALGHRGDVTSVQFLPDGRLLSASRDKTYRLWNLAEGSAQLATTIERPAGGDVWQLYASPDGKWVLIDQGRELRLVSLERRTVEGTLSNPVSEGGSFTTMALFSPDNRLALTAGSTEGRLQLWRLPTEKTRAYELRQLVVSDRSTPTCGAFSPDGQFLVTGSRDRQVYVWAMPTQEEIEHQLTALVTYIEPAVDSSVRQEVRIWAELDNKDGRLTPGQNVTMVAYPGQE
jgi:WD40 repeat protein